MISILGSLNPATNQEISKTICSSASTSCDLDPIPTWLLKLCFSEWLHVITNIIYLSLSTSTVPYNKLKMALIPPLLKKVLLDPWPLRSWRTSTLSNLTYLSKRIERAMVVRLTNIGSDENTLFRTDWESLHSTSFPILFLTRLWLKSNNRTNRQYAGQFDQLVSTPQPYFAAV